MKNLFIALVIFVSSGNLVAKEEVSDSPVKGLDHLGLTVKDLNKTADFFVNYLGFNVGGEDKKYPAKFLSNGDIFITLWQSDVKSTIEFNRKQNVGLHHLALKIETMDGLFELHNKIKDVDGVVIEFPPESFYGGASKHMMIREPSGNRIEFIHRVVKSK